MEEDQNTVQEEVNNLVRWSHRNQMQLNSTECKGVHLGINKIFLLQLGVPQLLTTVEEKDLGAKVDHRTTEPPI